MKEEKNREENMDKEKGKEKEGRITGECKEKVNEGTEEQSRIRSTMCFRCNRRRNMEIDCPRARRCYNCDTIGHEIRDYFQTLLL